LKLIKKLVISDITIVALNQSIANDIKNELSTIFGNALMVEALTIDELPNCQISDGSLILCHDPKVFLHSMNHISKDHTFLMTKRTISRDGLEKLKAIPAGKRCLAINMTEYSTLEMITAMYQLGINHIQILPYDRNSSGEYDVDYIISPVQFDEVDGIDAETILIGHRPLEISTLLDIIAMTEIDNELSEEIIRRQLKHVPTFWNGVVNTLADKRILFAYWQILFDEFSEAILICDESDNITMVNSKAEKKLNTIWASLVGKQLNELVIEIPGLEIFKSDKTVTNKVINFNKNKYVVNIHNVKLGNTAHGKIILFEEFDKIMDTHSSIRQQVIERGHLAKYSFNEIVGSSSPVIEAIEICKTIADSDATILLTGESGTGKEMFASALHNHSYRSKEPYVAINCATLPESILESELFGYEEGAFTGAKKGGRIGLFEQANNGTLFMDEIGELPLSIQARLLRVLQEKEIIRVGGGSIINVNTRIVAATNRDLKKMVDEGNFRTDLYYRLNVFQVPLPSLKERMSDIPILIGFYIKKLGSEMNVPEELMTFFMDYDWPGNIRELFNVLEYMQIFGKESFDIKHLPPYLKPLSSEEKKPEKSKDETWMFKDKELLILNAILSLESKNESTGRRSILKKLNQNDVYLSEGELRNRLKALDERQLIVISRGRGGCKLTTKGIEYIKEKK